MIQVVKTIAADNGDVLAGTDLENIPGSGQLDIFVASDADDDTITVTAPGQGTPIREQLIQEKSASLISLQDDLPISIPTIGGKYNVAINVTSGTVIKIIAIWRTLTEVMLESQFNK